MASEETEGLTEIDPVNEPRVRVEESAIDWGDERYKRIGQLGKGGMGEVQLCKDTRIARQVAMKVLKSTMQRDQAYRERFLFEARLQGQLEHPSIVPVHDLGETADGELYFTMKRIRGVTLAKAMEQARDGSANFTRRRLLTAFSSICLAVDFAHTRGVVHRDLKPQNIMLGDFGEVYIIDWGIAKLLDRQDTPIPELVEIPGSDTPTRAGSVLGTPLYMAPERRRGFATPGTDVYSLGVILGQILETDDDIAPELASISRHATEEDADMRFKSARELHDAIERFLDGDRDLEARRKAAQQHVARAEAALASGSVDARTAAARDIGRALGLDPANRAALQILMRLLSEVPKDLPAPVQAEIERRWIARRANTMRIGAMCTPILFLVIPFIVASGVRNWLQLAAFSCAIATGTALQWKAARTPRPAWMTVAFCMQFVAVTFLSTSIGLVGAVPATFTVMIVAWRQAVHRTSTSVAMLLFGMACLLTPFFLSAVGLMAPLYAFNSDHLIVIPHMHHFPRAATELYLIGGSFGVMAAAAIYGRLFVGEIRRAESQLTFQTWQLQQLIPPQ